MNGKKTDDLINDALSGLGEDTGEKQEADVGEIEEVTTDTGSTKEQVAKIDLQQYVSKEDYMRLAADFDNFRRRALKERKEWEQKGKDEILLSVLDILDNFSRGLQQSESDSSSLATGMRMVYSQMESLLEQNGLSKIETIGKKFNPSVHDAVGKRASEKKSDGEILEEVKCGWTYPDRLLRAASVIVVKNSSEGDQ